MSHEMEGWRRYAAVLGGMIVCGAACLLALPFLIAPRGTSGPTVLQAQSVPAAVTAMVLALAIAVVIAGVVGRLVNAAVGLFVLGAGLWVLRLRLATVQDLAFADGSFGLVALETALWCGLILAATWAVMRIAGPLRDIVPDEDEPVWWKAHGLHGAAAGALVLPVVWVVAQSPLRGQTLMAVVLGGMAAGLVGRLAAPHAQPYLLFAAPCLFGAIGQAVAASKVGSGVADAFVAGTLPAMSLPMPIDYAAGSLMGVAMGIGWAKGFLHHDDAT